MQQQHAIWGQLRELLEVGRRNSGADQRAIQAIHDGAQYLGAACGAQTEAARWVAEAAALVEAEMSFSDKERALRTALRAKYPETQNGPWRWICDTFDEYFVWSEETNGGASVYWQAAYSIDAAGKVTLGDPVKVVRQTVYTPVAESAGQGQPTAEAETVLVGDIIPLIEKAKAGANTIPVKLIAPGWGSSGYYSAEVLERDGPKVYPAGSHMYLDHPSTSEAKERPERSVKDLAAVLATDAKWEASGVDGPGLYAEAMPFSWAKPVIEELAPHIGVSIRALGRAVKGKAEGREGPVVEALVKGQSVDFVTRAGAGGKVLEILEAARGGSGAPAVEGEEDAMSEARIKALEEAVAELRESNRGLTTENARLKEGAVLRDAREFVAAELRGIQLPDMTRARLAESLTANPPVKDGSLDTEAYRTRIREAATAELEYLAKTTGYGSGRIAGMGSGGAVGALGSGPKAEDAEAALAESFRELGLSEKEAKLAAAGR